MVFVILGTQKQNFKRLLNEVKFSKILKDEEIIVQAGYTKYECNRMKIFDFMSNDEFENYIDKAELIITHGGVGSIMAGIIKNKKVIAMPRLKKYNEHLNDHQVEICEKLYKLGYITYFNPEIDEEDLDKKINYARTSNFYKYIKDDSYLKIVENSIDNLLK